MLLSSSSVYFVSPSVYSVINKTYQHNITFLVRRQRTTRYGETLEIRTGDRRCNNDWGAHGTCTGNPGRGNDNMCEHPRSAASSTGRSHHIFARAHALVGSRQDPSAEATGCLVARYACSSCARAGEGQGQARQLTPTVAWASSARASFARPPPGCRSSPTRLRESPARNQTASAARPLIRSARGVP